MSLKHLSESEALELLSQKPVQTRVLSAFEDSVNV